jgi:hypothetical protein
LWTAGALISIAVFAFGIYRFIGGRAAAQASRSGDHVGDVLLRDTSGRAVALPGGHWYAVLVGSVEDDASLVHALQSETARRTPAGPPVTAIVLARDRKPDLEAYMTRTPPAVRVVPVDGHREVLASGLRLVDDRTQLLLVNPSRDVVFRGGAPKVTDVKLLFERFLPLPNDQAAPAAPLRVGDPLVSSAANVVNLRTERRDRPATPLLCVLFTGRCTTCALQTHMKMTRSVESAIQRRATAAGATPALMFTSYFSPPRLREQLAALDFKLPAYQVTSELPRVEELAQRDGADVLVVETGADGRITRIVPLAAFVQELIEVQQ